MALRFHLGLFIFNPFRVEAYPAPLPQVPPGAIQIQPFQGWGRWFTPPQVPPGAIHIQPFQGWGRWLVYPTPGSTWGYSDSTLSGLGPLVGLPQVFLRRLSRSARNEVQIISRSELLRFNPYRGWIIM
jgi:hypothetical protein